MPAAVPPELAAVPALAFFTVSAADGSLDAEELAQFRQVIGEAEAAGAGGEVTFAAAVAALAADPGGLDAAAADASEAVLTGTAGPLWDAARGTLDDLPGEVAGRFRADAVAFGRRVAAASAGPFAAGPAVDEAETAALVLIDRVLGGDGDLPDHDPGDG